MRFIHTADWHLGLKANHVARAADRVRKARLDVIDEIGRVTAQERAEFIIVAGDVFDDNYVSLELVRQALERLARLPVDTFIIPGNHDFFGPDSIFRIGAFSRLPSNVHVFAERRPVELSRYGCVLFPCPTFQKFTMTDPTGWIEPEGFEGLVRIGIAHGSLTGIGQDNDNPISPDAAVRAALDYLALGHWHSYYTNSPRLYYSGAPEATKFGEKGSGDVLVVDIAGPGETPSVQRKRVGKLHWVEKQFTAAEPHQTSLRELQHWLEGLGNPKSTLVRLGVQGVLSGEGHEELLQLLDDAKRHFLYFSADVGNLSGEILYRALKEFTDGRPVTKGVIADLQAMLASLERRSLDPEATAIAAGAEELRKIEVESLLPDDTVGAIGKEDLQTALQLLATIVEEVRR